MATNSLDQVSTHLQFLGYEISREGELLTARHQIYPNIVIRPFAGGILFTSPFECSDNAKRNHLGYLTIPSIISSQETGDCDGLGHPTLLHQASCAHRRSKTEGLWSRQPFRCERCFCGAAL